MNNFFEKILEKYISYFDGKFVSKIKNLELAIKILFIFLFMMFLFLIATVSYSLKAANEKTIEITLTKDTIENGQVYKVERGTASKNYFESIAYAVVHEITSYDYSTVQRKANFVLSLVHPNKYEEVYEELKREADFAVENRVVQDFKIRDWTYRQIDASNAEIKASGILVRKVGGVEVINNKKYTTSVSIRISNGLPFVSGIALNRADKETEKREERKDVIDNYDRSEKDGGMKYEKVKN